MSVYDNTDAIIQDNTTISGVNAVEFSDAISNMNRAIDIMNSNLTTTMKIQDQYASILSYYDNFEDDLREVSTCLNAYLKGTRSSFIDTSVVYTNEIRTSESQNSFADNQILIRSHKGTTDASGNILYNNPVITIKDASVTIPILENSSMWTKKSYVVIDDMSENDINIDDPSSQENTLIKTVNRTIEKAFDPETGFVVKLKISNGDFTEFVSNNELYIDPASPIFNVSSNENLNCLKDENNNINYTAIISYLVAEVQRLKAAMKSTGVYQDLSYLTDEEFYGEIFNTVPPNNTDELGFE